MESWFLEQLNRTGEYRVLDFGGPELIGRPGHHSSRRPLQFYATMDVEMGGTKAIVAENISIVRVDGRFSIVNFKSVDHFVRYRVYEFQLPRVANPQLVPDK